MDKNEELQKWLNDDRYVRAQELVLPLNMDNGQVIRLLQKHKIHAVKRIYIGRNIDGQYLGQLAFFDKNQCLAFLEKWENGYDKHLFMSLNDICDTFNTNLGVVNLFFKRNKIKKCAMHRDANHYRIALYDKQLIITLWTTERGLLQNLQPNPDFCIISELAILFKISDSHVRRILRFYNIKPVLKNPSAIPDLYCKKQCIDSINSFNAQKKYEHYNNDSLNQLLTNPKYIMKTELANELGLSKAQINNIFKKQGIVPFKKIYTPHGLRAFYDRAECERARPFINQPEQKEVEKVEEKQMELPEPKEQSPDIIPADTIDLFTMSELESELKNRGVELTTEVRNKISASDMPEMQHIATMLRGNAKTIAIRLSVLNEIAGQLAKADERKNITKKAENVLRYAAQKKSLRKCDTGVLNSFGYLTNNQAFEAIRPFITKSEALEMPCFANSIIKAYLSNNKTYVVLWDKEVVQEFIANEKTKLNLIESIRPVVDCIPDQKINTITDSDGENKLDKILSRLNEIEYQIVYHENFGPSEDIINHFKSAIQSRSNVLSALMSRAKIVIHNESCVILLDQKFAVDKVGESKSKETINNALMDIGCKDFNIYVLFSGKQDVKNNQEK